LASSWPDTNPVSSTVTAVKEGIPLVTGADEPTAYMIRFVGTQEECCKKLKEMNERMK
jgi:hypothetical protein